MTNRLVVALFYEIASTYRSRGYNPEDCLEFHPEETIDAIAASIESNGYEAVRVGDIQELVQRMAKGEHERWDIAFSVSEGMHGTGREAQIPGLLEAYQIPHVFSDAATLALCMDKGKTKMIFQQSGIATAPFAVVPAFWTKADCKVMDLLEMAPHCQTLHGQFPLFIKPACEGASKGIYPLSKVNNLVELEEGIQTLQTRFPRQSILIEPFLAGSEYTVSVLGTGRSSRVIGTMHLNWDGPSGPKSSDAETAPSAHSDFFHSSNKSYVGKRVVTRQESAEVQQAEDLALQAWRVLECCDIGRVDIRFGADGRPYVLEISPLPGFRPSGSALPVTALHNGMNHEMLIGKVLDSALERYPHLCAKPNV
ncbi:hypothetical protein BDV37DRAFT_263735 [Aspergillus pseudonomiae]|uniref:ATP-grasp domain-containing protein n=1 Tax=Aspergillus pseudonomiae TaxID=1506151 RepID=A0A5N7CVQ3_9EURO|nr:uncharacterized protein BDV37DRAFT_263735 [Aspergillus pseudonomiae]KAE8398260.1 hypothetical protein BDV37DRAFT_263735 [Aspergillus pseudonomiae]